jgi:predicted acyltransferase
MTPRALSIDALRGLAIIGMILSGSITFAGSLPAWMYHAQVPPPEHHFVPTLAGITWVDLVFPFFLFSMGAAIPLSFQFKMHSGDRLLPETWREYLVQGLPVLRRGLLLAFFAIFTQHIKIFAYSTTEPRWMPHLIGLLGYALLFLTFTRFPRKYVKSAQMENILQASGIAVSAALMVFLSYPPHPSFGIRWNPFRSDIILLVLSNVAVFGTVIWLLTRTNTMLRLGLLALYAALRLSLDEAAFVGSWQQMLWFATPAGWLFKVYFLQYLFIVIPGTIAGEIIVESLRNKGEHREGETFETPVKSSLRAFLAFAFIPVNLVGLFSRELWWNLAANLVLIALGYWLFRPTRSLQTNPLQTNPLQTNPLQTNPLQTNPLLAAQKLHHTLWNWGVYWLLLGLAFEVFEGGIKKDKSTLSYYFLTSGLAFLLLITLHICTEELKLWRVVQAVFTSIIECGQNPMIAYVTGGMLLVPLLGLTGLQTWYNTAFSGAWLGFARGVAFTGLVIVITQVFTKWRIFWRT